MLNNSQVSGIYFIKNIINNKIYVGQSKDIYSRFNSHKSCLKKNKHRNKYLQRSYNKYGLDSFEYNIIEECLEDIRDEREIYYINLYKTCDSRYGYNLESGGHFGKNLSEEPWRRYRQQLKDQSV